MADFNAYPSLDIRPVDYSAIPRSYAELQAQQNALSLFPLQQQQMQQQTDLRALQVRQAQQADLNQQLVQAASRIDDSDPEQAARQWDTNMQALVDAGHPEAKQWIGKYSLKNKGLVGQLYGTPMGAGGQLPAPGAQPLGGGAANAFAPEGSTARYDLNTLTPDQAAQHLQKSNAIVGELDQVFNSNNPAAAWSDVQARDPDARALGPYNPQKLQEVRDQQIQMQRVYMQRFGQNMAGFPTERNVPEIVKGAGGSITSLDVNAPGGPKIKELRGPEKLFAPVPLGQDDAGQPVIFDPNSMKAITLPVKVGEPRYGKTGAAAGGMVSPELAEAQPESASILAQTGLSEPGFLALTGQASQLPRDKDTRARAFAQAEEFANKRGVDVSTLASQYKANNEVLQKNIERVNQTKIMEGELNGTLANLKPVADAAALGQLRVANVAKVWAGQEVNDPIVQQYAFQLNQLRNELAAYNGALQGRSGSSLNEHDMSEAERVIKEGLSSGGAGGLQKAVAAATQKMTGVMEGNIDSARKNIWDLFGVGKNYKPQYGGGAQAGAAGGAIPYANAAGGPQIPVMRTPDDARKLAPGTVFMTPDGRRMVR